MMTHRPRDAERLSTDLNSLNTHMSSILLWYFMYCISMPTVYCIRSSRVQTHQYVASLGRFTSTMIPTLYHEKPGTGRLKYRKTLLVKETEWF